MKEEIPGQGRTPKQYSDSMKIISISIVGLFITLFLLLFTSCTKEITCTATRVYKGSEKILETKTMSSTTILEIETDYLVVIECN